MAIQNIPGGGVSIPYPGAENIALVTRSTVVTIPAGTTLLTEIDSGIWYQVPDDRVLVLQAANVYQDQSATSSTQNPLIRQAHLVYSWNVAGVVYSAEIGLNNGYGAVPGTQYPADYNFSGAVFIAPGRYMKLQAWFSVGSLGSVDAVDVYFGMQGYTMPLGNINLNG